jgi:Arc/MetJ-type ribon-helix-helix transcriptional regulator
MPSRNGTLKQVRIAVRLSPQDHEKIERALKDKGYANVSTFIRAAIDNEIGRRTELLDAEQRIAASFDRLSRDVFRVARGQQALFALVYALTKTILTCMPEPWSEQQKIEFAAPEYLRNVIRIVTETGLRIYKELTPMKKDQLDLVNRTVWIPDSKTPNGVAEVPLTDIAVDAFRNQLAISGPGL